MSSKQKRNYCTDATWLGRSDCKHCSIRNLMLFSGLPDSAFDDRLTSIDHFIFPAGSTLFEEGRDDGAIYSVRSGMVKLLSMMPGGEHRIVRMLGTGSAIGLEMLEPGNRYQHTAVALNDVDACRIPVKTINALESSFPELCQQIRQRLLRQLDRADQWIVSLSTGTAKKRIAHLLLMMTEYSSDENGDITMLGGADIAAIIGSSPETVSRVLADMKRSRVIQKVATNVYRCNKAALETITEKID
jgi:CRP-like cAMP-binding protein